MINKNKMEAMKNGFKIRLLNLNEIESFITRNEISFLRNPDESPQRQIIFLIKMMIYYSLY